MTLARMDLNLLFVFDALTEHRSVTKAAEALDLTQSAASAALSRLRVALGDPLFVKAGHEMRPTPRAVELAAPVKDILLKVRTELLRAKHFDPQTARHTFTVLTPDIGEINVMPKLVKLSDEAAPGLNFRTLALSPHLAAEAIDSGQADIAVGYFPDLQRSSLFHQLVARNRHVCMVRTDHPMVENGLDLKQFLAASHVVVRPDGRDHVFEQYLSKQQLTRRVRLEVAHFMSLLPIVSQSDLIATVPEDIAAVLARYGTVRIVPVPLDAPTIEIHQYWHSRNNADPAHAWLRESIRLLLSPRQAASSDQ